MKTERLTSVDWIAAAFRRLGTGGVVAVRAEVLARDLGVSKGSFYWHFRDLPDLRLRMLEHWRDQATARIIALTVDAGADPAAQLSRLLDLATSDLADPYGGLSTEAAIRDWARTDAAAAKAQAESDQLRGDFLTQLLVAAGLPDHNARQTARLILMAYTGAVHLGIADRVQLRLDLQQLAARLLVDQPNTPAVSAAKAI